MVLFSGWVAAHEDADEIELRRAAPSLLNSPVPIVNVRRNNYDRTCTLNCFSTMLAALLMLLASFAALTRLQQWPVLVRDPREPFELRGADPAIMTIQKRYLLVLSRSAGKSLLMGSWPVRLSTACETATEELYARHVRDEGLPSAYLMDGYVGDKLGIVTHQDGVVCEWFREAAGSWATRRSLGAPSTTDNVLSDASAVASVDAVKQSLLEIDINSTPMLISGPARFSLVRSFASSQTSDADQ
jgi:hypothetical protein